MAKENISQEFRLNNIKEARNCFIEEIHRLNFISKNHSKVFTALNYVHQSLIFVCSVHECVSMSVFASLVDIPVGNASSAIIFCNNCRN